MSSKKNHIRLAISKGLALSPILGFIAAYSPLIADEGDAELSGEKQGNDIVLGVNLSTEGIYQIEQSSNLGNWTELTTEASDGLPFQVSDPITGSNKFYRVNRTPQPNAAYSSGVNITQLFAQVDIVNLRSAFGLPSTVQKTADFDTTNLGSKTTDERLYLASLISLAKIASDIQDGMTFYFGIELAIANALVSDLSDGNLDGRNGGSVITIVPTSETLDSKVTDAIVLAAFVDSQQGVAGLRNLTISQVQTASAATASRTTLSSPMFAPVAGKFSVTIPAVWAEFYWDSAEWQ
jgi:hypothetical protein